MDKSKLYQLLSAYLTQKKGSSKDKEMDKAIRQTSDEELGSVLSDLWNDYELTESYDTEIKALYNRLERRIHSKKIRLQLNRYAKYAAIFLIPLLSALTAYLLVERNSYRADNTYFSVHVDPGKSSDVVLPDGTRVMLNSQSSIVYNNDNQLHQRKVNLKGEAHFKVTKNPKKPFVVSTECFDVEVLGTTFNVKTYESDDIHVVALLEGKVKLTTRNPGNNNSIYLLPNQKAVYDRKTGKLTIETTDNVDETAWMKGILAFNRESLHNIKLELERKYGVHIQMNCPAIEYDTFTGYFSDETLKEVLDNLKIHYGFSYAINRNKVQIYPCAKPLQ
ncbi:MAG: FecR domain-containing protein [Bacteroidota bacterium]|nr:FecR domain-containing protein [Bacteroidota bacterium]